MPGPISSASARTRRRLPRARCRSGPPRPAKPVKQKPSELEAVEKLVAELEVKVAEVEARLAADWTNLDVLAAHTAAQEELQKQLARWEALFEAEGAGSGADSRSASRLQGDDDDNDAVTIAGDSGVEEACTR